MTMHQITSSADLDKWDHRLLTMAHNVAQWSKDPNEKVGAVLASPDRRSLSVGYNGFPRGVADDARLDSDEKNELSVHAELNAILNARRDLSGWTLYCTKFPCRRCAHALSQAGLMRVVAHHPKTGSKWFANQMAATEDLMETRVHVVLVGEYLI